MWGDFHTNNEDVGKPVKKKGSKLVIEEVESEEKEEEPDWMAKMEKSRTKKG